MRMLRWIVLLLVVVVVLFLPILRLLTDQMKYGFTTAAPALDTPHRNEFPMGHDMSNDRIMEQIDFIPTELKFHPVLIYVPKDVASVRSSNSEFQIRQCKVKNCILSSLASHRLNANVVFFSPTSTFAFDYPRPLEQLWVLQLLESPENTMNLSDFNGRVNYTASYRYDSDLVTPYGKWVLSRPYLKSAPFSPRRKPKDVLWLVSHCITNNARMQYANQLARYIQVDVYGDCGEMKIPKAEGIRMLKEEYRFYLSFENSNCEQYVTEKLFDNALQNNAVPIVMGASVEFYESIAPPHSFIHVDQYDSPEDLAKYLRYLSSNEKAYNEYFAWRNLGYFTDTKLWCRLCSLAQQPVRKVYTDIEHWWHSPNQCSRRRQGIS